MAMGNPAMAQMARSVIESLSQRGAGPSQQGGPQGGSASTPEMAGAALSGRLNELQGADPAAILQKIQAMKQQTVELIPHVAFSLPGVAKHLTKLWQALDGAIKEAEQALSTQKSVQSAPIGMSAANPPQAAGPPGPQGGSPFMQSGGLGGR